MRHPTCLGQRVPALWTCAPQRRYTSEDRRDPMSYGSGEGECMSPTITEVEVLDIRFPTSERLDGSDAMNPDPDYSAAYVVLRTDAPATPDGHGFCFTIGRGIDVTAAAIRSLRPYVEGRDVDSVTGDLCDLYRA